jgi:beta-glucanase (GH16 family)
MTRKPEAKETFGSALFRRSYLTLAGASVPILGGVHALTGATTAQMTDGGPPNADAWELAFEDTFTGNSLNTESWEIGFGWGTETNNSAESISADHVTVADDQLHITASPENGVEAGCINTKDRVTVSPGTYIEARLRPPKRTGFLPAFWAKPNSEAWPPELDFFELFQDGSGSDDWTTAHYNVHYSSSGEPGDGSTHESDPTNHDVGSDLTTAFHVYGCKWLSDRVEWYFDGQKVGESTDATAMDALERGAPFYLMLNIHVDKIGTTDRTETWDEELTVDWVRLWNQSGDGGTKETTTDAETGTRYFWARSGDGNTVSFEFEVSAGNVRIHSDDTDVDYWVTDDGTIGGGTTDKTSGLPGFWFDGDIERLEYDGELDLFIDDEAVDPDQYVVEEDAARRYFWARSGDGNTVSFEFEASAGNVSIHSDDTNVDYWVADNGTIGGGTTDKTSGLPGFWFDGDIERLEYDGELDLFIDDEAVDPNQYVVEDETETREPLARSLTFDGSDADAGASYEASVTERIQATDTTENDDTVSESSVSGTLDGDADGYTFSGIVTGLTTDDGVRVDIDGEPVSQVRVERADGSSGTVSYLLETSGRVLPVEETIESDDEYANGKMLGTVAGGADEFWLVGGELTDVSTFRGDVVTTVSKN